MGHTQSSEEVKVSSPDKSLSSEPMVPGSNNNSDKVQSIRNNNLPTITFNTNETSQASYSDFNIFLSELTNSPTEISDANRPTQQTSDSYFSYNGPSSETNGKSTNFTRKHLSSQNFSSSSSTSSHDDYTSSESSFGGHSRSYSVDNNNKNIDRSSSLRTPIEFVRRQSSYHLHCSRYLENGDEPLKWKKRRDSKRRSTKIRNSSYLITESNNLSHTYKEAMDKLCGENNNLLSTYSNSSLQSDDDFCNSTNTSVTALSSVNDELNEEISSLDPKSLFGSEKFSSLPETHVLSLIQRDDVGGHSEVDIWRNLIKWGIHNTNPKINFDQDINNWSSKDFELLARTLRNCIYWIRFSQMTPVEFQAYVMPFRPIIPQYIIGNFLRQKITGHPQFPRIMAPQRIPTTPINSTIITGRHATILSNWIKNDEQVGIKPKYQFNLLYRASRDGGSSNAFHQKCDNQGPTIIIIKLSGHSKFIGGYNAMSYQNSSKRSSLSSLSKRNSINRKIEKFAQENCFIFSLQDSYYPEETAIVSRIIPESKKEAIIKHKWDGPCFGKGDLVVCPDKKNKILESRQESYEKSIIEPGTFVWEDFEVFQVVNQ